MSIARRSAYSSATSSTDRKGCWWRTGPTRRSHPLRSTRRAGHPRSEDSHRAHVPKPTVGLFGGHCGCPLSCWTVLASVCHKSNTSPSRTGRLSRASADIRSIALCATERRRSTSIELAAAPQGRAARPQMRRLERIDGYVSCLSPTFGFNRRPLRVCCASPDPLRPSSRTFSVKNAKRCLALQCGDERLGAPSGRLACELGHPFVDRLPRNRVDRYEARWVADEGKAGARCVGWLTYGRSRGLRRTLVAAPGCRSGSPEGPISKRRATDPPEPTFSEPPSRQFEPLLGPTHRHLGLPAPPRASRARPPQRRGGTRRNEVNPADFSSNEGSARRSACFTAADRTDRPCSASWAATVASLSNALWSVVGTVVFKGILR